jgi:4-amino-4-deoxy-L-arabinose transferase-like glycosyltransferase
MNHRDTETQRSQKRAIFTRSLCLVFSVSLCLCGSLLFFYRLGDRDLWSSHEARAGQDAQTMLSDGHWGLPHLFDGTPDLQKPPLYYWGVAVIGWLRGGVVDAWAVRLPATLSALALVLGLFGALWRSGRTVAGIVGATVLATALHFTWLARVGRIDMPLSLTTAVVIVAFVRARRQPTALSALPGCLVGYLSLAAGVLLKGPIGAVLPFAVVGGYVLVEGDWRPRTWPGLLHRLGVWWGLPLMAALTVPWFLWANAQTDGEFFRVFFWHHNVERGLGGAADLAEHPWWFYLPRFSFDFLPWTPLLPLALWLLWRRRWWRADAAARLGLVWLVVVVGLLSCARFKRADYLLPAFPGAALLLGCVAQRWYETARHPWVWKSLFATVVLGCVAGWTVYVTAVLPRSEARLEQRRFAARIRHLVPPPERVLLFWTEPHALVFHLGREVQILIEWDRLDAELAAVENSYVIMPPEIAVLSVEHLRLTRLEEVLRNTDFTRGKHDKPLVLLRAQRLTSSPGFPHARAAAVAASDRSASQSDPPGSQ